MVLVTIKDSITGKRLGEFWSVAPAPVEGSYVMVRGEHDHPRPCRVAYVVWDWVKQHPPGAAPGVQHVPTVEVNVRLNSELPVG